MDIVDYLITNISQLPWIVFGPGLFLIAVFLLKAVGQVFRLRLISVVTNILYAFIVALVMARYGQDIAAFVLDVIESQPTV